MLCSPTRESNHPLDYTLRHGRTRAKPAELSLVLLLPWESWFIPPFPLSSLPHVEWLYLTKIAIAKVILAVIFYFYQVLLSLFNVISDRVTLYVWPVN